MPICVALALMGGCNGHPSHHAEGTSSLDRAATRLDAPTPKGAIPRPATSFRSLPTDPTTGVAYHVLDLGHPDIPKLTPRQLAQVHKAERSVAPADRKTLWFAFGGYQDDSHNRFVLFESDMRNPTKSYDGQGHYRAVGVINASACNLAFNPATGILFTAPSCF